MHAAARSIGIATVTILTSVASYEAFAKGGIKSDEHPIISSAEAATINLSKATTTETVGFGGCGGRRYRDPNTHRCRGPADFGN